jgi:putative redox protein
MYKVNIRWLGKHQYLCEGHERRHAMVMDIPVKSGGYDTSFHATELLLIAVGKCSAVDVVNILTKQRVKLDDVSVEVTGEISKDYPKYYTHIHLKYIVSGENVDRARVERAVELSQTKYCTVKNSLTDKCKVTTEIEIQ